MFVLGWARLGLAVETYLSSVLCLEAVPSLSPPQVPSESPDAASRAPVFIAAPFCSLKGGMFTTLQLCVQPLQGALSSNTSYHTGSFSTGTERVTSDPEATHPGQTEAQLVHGFKALSL